MTDTQKRYAVVGVLALSLWWIVRPRPAQGRQRPYMGQAGGAGPGQTGSGGRGPGQ